MLEKSNTAISILCIQTWKKIEKRRPLKNYTCGLGEFIFYFELVLEILRRFFCRFARRQPVAKLPTVIIK